MVHSCVRYSQKLGCVAQLVEHLPLKQMVPGSSPGAPTIKKSCYEEGALRLIE